MLVIKPISDTVGSADDNNFINLENRVFIFKEFASALESENQTELIRQQVRARP